MIIAYLHKPRAAIVTLFFILLPRGHEKVILLSWDNGLFSCDNRMIYQVSFHHINFFFFLIS